MIQDLNTERIIEKYVAKLQEEIQLLKKEIKSLKKKVTKLENQPQYSNYIP